MVAFALLLTAAGSWVAGRIGARTQTRHFMLRLFLLGYSARLVFAVAFLTITPRLVFDHPYLSYGFFGDDGMAYDRDAWRIASQGFGSLLEVLDAAAIPGSRGYIFLNAVIYALFGQQVLAVRIFDGFLGALVPLFVYDIGARLVQRRWARFAALLTAWYPEQILYSVVQLKDISVTFAMTGFLWFLFRWKDQPGVMALAGELLCIAYLGLTRFYMVPPLVLGAVVGRFPRRGLGRWPMVCATIASVLLVWAFYRPAASAYVYYPLEGQARAEGSLYAVFNGVSGADLMGRLMLAPLALAYTLMNPFVLWPLLQPDPVYTYLLPAIAAWYVLLPFVLIGWIGRWRHAAWREIVVVLLGGLLLLSVSGGALASGRLKVPLQPLFFICAAQGLDYWANRKPAALAFLSVYPVAISGVILVYLLLRYPDMFSAIAVALGMLGAIALRCLGLRVTKHRLWRYRSVCSIRSRTGGGRTC